MGLQKRSTLKPGRRKQIRAILRSLESRFFVRKSFKLGVLIRAGGDCEEPVHAGSATERATRLLWRHGSFRMSHRAVWSLIRVAERE